MADPYRFLTALGQERLRSCISVLFGHDEELLRFFFSHKEPVLRMSAKAMVRELGAGSLRVRDQLLVRVALEYWNRRGYARLGDMLSEWDLTYWLQFLHSLAMLEEVEHDLLDRLKGEQVPCSPRSR